MRRSLPLLQAALRLGQGGYADKVLSIRPNDLLMYLPLSDPAGSAIARDASGNNRNGAVNADVTLGVPGPDGGTAAVRNGSTVSEGINLYSTSLRDAFVPGELTMSIWALASSTIWAATTPKSLFQLRADINNRIILGKSGTIPTFSFSYIAGGTSKSVVYVTSSPLTWFHACFTVSKTSDQAKAYFLGSQVGSTLTGLGTWVGNLVNGVNNLFGYSSGGYWEPAGYGAHAALWKAPLSAAEVAELASPFDRPGLRFMAIGDSKTANTPNWPDFLTESGYGLIHQPQRYAAGGWTTQNVRDGIDAALASKTETPDLVLVNLGANDVNGGDPGPSWKTNTAYIADALRSKWPSVRVYLTKVWRRNTGSQAVGIAALNGYIDQLVAEPARAPWLKVGVNEADYLPGGDDGATYTSDGVHPNSAGCLLSVSAWRSVLGV